ncbi:hypothetical protein [Sphingomonas sp. Leaf4]|uniref:hypothetical protein n=1 Tax=Sphingomonas sp. Leaf4 TaxID=2876553 RepID=UPI001E62CC93|nr:hypothetical protein [Sphingomonas sp. Leaf4]
MTEEYENRVREDVTKVACEELSDVLNRRIRIAATVLQPHDLTLMLTEIASSVLRGAIIFGVQRAKDGHVDGLIDDVVQHVVRSTNASKPEILAVAAAMNGGTRGSALMDVVRAARSGSAING